MKHYKTIFQVRRGQEAEWVSLNPVLREGEPGFAIDAGIFKIGDGVRPWNELAANDSILLNFNSRTEFPSTGLARFLYRDVSAAQLYQFNTATGEYELLSSMDGLQELLDQKVDKEEGKSLSSNDFTSELKTKLESIDIKDTTSYIHTQLAPSALWEISHNLDRYPSVSVVDSAGTVVVGDVNYINSNLIRVSFSGAFSGKAYIS